MSTVEQAYLLEPKSPLVFRSGLPFETGLRERANYPWPSAWAGLLRSRWMEMQGWHSVADDPTRHAAVLAMTAHGVHLARRSATGLHVHVAKPADAFPERNSPDSAAFTRLVPHCLHDDVGCDLPGGLLSVGPETDVEGMGKPGECAPLWSLDDYVVWAAGGAVKRTPEHALPLEDQRTHVAIDGSTLAADEGRLFRTAGLDFGSQRRPANEATRYGDGDWVLLGSGPAGLTEGLVAFGGERRLSVLKALPDNPLAMPAGHLRRFDGARGFVVNLATPAVFSDGWKPGWLDQNLEGELPEHPGLRVRLRAALIEGWQAISGWDLRLRKPKPTRRAVAAGAAYWFEIVAGTLDPDALWLTPLSDEQQARRDGFGLALIRPWTPIS